MKTVGNLLLATGSGLGVWVLTNLDQTGVTDIAIVFLFIAVGATFKHAGDKNELD